MWFRVTDNDGFKPTLKSWLIYLCVFTYISLAMEFNLFHEESSDPVTWESRIRAALYAPIMYFYFVSLLCLVVDGYTLLKNKLNPQS